MENIILGGRKIILRGEKIFWGEKIFKYIYNILEGKKIKLGGYKKLL